MICKNCKHGPELHEEQGCQGAIPVTRILSVLCGCESYIETLSPKEVEEEMAARAEDAMREDF